MKRSPTSPISTPILWTVTIVLALRRYNPSGRFATQFTKVMKGVKGPLTLDRSDQVNSSDDEDSSDEEARVAAYHKKRKKKKGWVAELWDDLDDIFDIDDWFD